MIVAHGMPIAWLRSAREIAGGDSTGGPYADFDDPGVAFAGTPERITDNELLQAIGVLERFIDEID